MDFFLCVQLHSCAKDGNMVWIVQGEAKMLIDLCDSRGTESFSEICTRKARLPTWSGTRKLFRQIRTALRLLFLS